MLPSSNLTLVLYFGYSWGGNIHIANATIEPLSLPSIQQPRNNSWAENATSKYDKQVAHLKSRYYKTAEMYGEIIW